MLHCTQDWKKLHWVRGSQGELRKAGCGGLGSKEGWERGFGLQLRFPKWCFSPRREAPGRAGPRVIKRARRQRLTASRMLSATVCLRFWLANADCAPAVCRP